MQGLPHQLMGNTDGILAQDLRTDYSLVVMAVMAVCKQTACVLVVGTRVLELNAECLKVFYTRLA